VAELFQEVEDLPADIDVWGIGLELYLADVRRTVLTRSLPLATRTVRIEQSPLADSVGLRGAAFMVVEELLSPAHLTATEPADVTRRELPSDMMTTSRLH
jgi:hypothetical protein